MEASYICRIDNEAWSPKTTAKHVTHSALCISTSFCLRQENNVIFYTQSSMFQNTDLFTASIAKTRTNWAPRRRKTNSFIMLHHIYFENCISRMQFIPEDDETFMGLGLAKNTRSKCFSEWEQNGMMETIGRRREWNRCTSWWFSLSTGFAAHALVNWMIINWLTGKATSLSAILGEKET